MQQIGCNMNAQFKRLNLHLQAKTITQFVAFSELPCSLYYWCHGSSWECKTGQRSTDKMATRITMLDDGGVKMHWFSGVRCNEISLAGRIRPYWWQKQRTVADKTAQVMINWTDKTMQEKIIINIARALTAIEGHRSPTSEMESMLHIYDATN